MLDLENDIEIFKQYSNFNANTFDSVRVKKAIKKNLK
jgi:hypothetical protein